MPAFTLKERTPGGVIYVQWTDHTGRFQRKSADTRDKKLARRRAPQIMAGSFAAPSPAQRAATARQIVASGVTMAHLFDRCFQTCWTPQKLSKMDTARSNVRILNPLIGDELVTAMTNQRLEELVRELRGMGYAEATIDRKLSAVGKALSEACKFLDSEGKPYLVGKPPMPEIVSNNFKTRTVSPAEEKLIFDAIEKRAQREPMRDWRRFGYLIRFLLDTGCRLGETCKLRAEWVEDRLVNDVPRVSAFFPKKITKNKKDKTVWLTKAIIETLPYLRMTATDGRLFPYKTQTAWYQWNTIREDLKAAGHDLDDVVLHTLRHTCLTRMARSGKFKIDEISRWAGHAGIQITMDRYLHMIPTDTAHLVDHLDAMAG